MEELEGVLAKAFPLIVDRLERWFGFLDATQKGPRATGSNLNPQPTNLQSSRPFSAIAMIREASWNFPRHDHGFKEFRGFPGMELGIFRVAKSSGEGRDSGVRCAQLIADFS